MSEKRRWPAGHRTRPEGVRMRAAGLAVAAACVLSLARGAAGASLEPPPGAAACSGCHSAKVETRVPRLAGRKPAEIASAMRAFRSGQQAATVMDRIAKGFTDDEVGAIADWFGALRGESVSAPRE